MLNVKQGIGERAMRVLMEPLSAKGTFGEGMLVVGRARVDMAAQRATQMIARMQAQVSLAGLSGSVELWDVTAGDTLLRTHVVDSDQPTDIILEFDIDLTSPVVYELRAGLDSGPVYNDTDFLTVWFARLELTTVF